MNLENGKYELPSGSVLSHLEQMLLESQARVERLEERFDRLTNEVGRVIDLVRMGFAKVNEQL